jgi:hypothetical protein
VPREQDRDQKDLGVLDEYDAFIDVCHSNFGLDIVCICIS